MSPQTLPTAIAVTFGERMQVPPTFDRDGLTYEIRHAKFVSHERIKALYTLKGYSPNASDGPAAIRQPTRKAIADW